MSPRVTSHDVARLAGVSRATVSYVLNDTPGQSLPAATRAKVLAAAAQLRYTPQASARSLRRGRSDIVLLLTPDWPIGPTLAALMDELGRKLGEHGLLMIAYGHPAERSLGELWRAITPAAVILIGSLGAAADAELRASRVPSYALDQGDRFASMNTRGGRLQAEHLAATGRRRLLYAVPDDERLRAFWQLRADGVRLACADLGLELPLQGVVAADLDVTAERLRTWLTAGIDGICAYNDEIAMVLLAAARRVGVSIPGQLSVIGHDDIPAAALLDPALTTVAVDAKAFAGALASQVVSGLAGAGSPVRTDSSMLRLVVRQSA